MYSYFYRLTDYKGLDIIIIDFKEKRGLYNMKCPKCGENIADSAKFCTKCGCNIPEALEEKKKQEAEEIAKRKAEEE